MRKCYGRQPDSGNPTVRDENGGLRKRDLNKGSYKIGAPEIYPNYAVIPHVRICAGAPGNRRSLPRPPFLTPFSDPIELPILYRSE